MVVNMIGELLQVQSAAQSDKVLNSAEELVKHDPYGLYLSLIAITIVITVLSFIYIAFKLLNKLLFSPRPENKTKIVPGRENDKVAPNGEITAAIAMALFLYKKEMDDTDDLNITLRKITHHYSPWSSKIYTLRNYPKN